MEIKIKRLILVFAPIVSNVFSAFAQSKPMNEMVGETAVSVETLKGGCFNLFD